jgi:hypothetical protein
MCECRDPVDFVRTQQNWMFEAIRLTVSDIRPLAGNRATLTGNAIRVVRRDGHADDGALKAAE